MMFNSTKKIAALLMLVLPGVAMAELKVQEAWARATVPAQTSTGVFMRLHSSEAVKLIAAESPVAGVVELHEMKMVGSTMKMRAVTGIDLPANQVVALKPGGYHVMLLDLKQKPLKAGDSVPLKLKVQAADGKVSTIETMATVRGLGSSSAGDHHHGH